MKETALWTWREVLLVLELWVLQYSANLLPHHPDRDVFCEVDCSHSRRIPRGQRDAFSLLGISVPMAINMVELLYT